MMQNDNSARSALVSPRPGSDQTGTGGGVPSTIGSSTAAQSLSQPSTSGQVGPLPVKRGEFGYEEPAPPELAHLPSSRDVTTTSPLPAVHPADRSSPSISPGLTPQGVQPANDQVSTHSSSSTHSKLLRLLKAKRIPSLYGVRLTTLGWFFLHVAILTATIAGWALLVQHLSAAQSPSSGNSGLGAASSTIFVHVAFGVACLAQLIFLERRIFRIRAERYFYLNPGLPMHAHEGDVGMGFAPWNRPPLPTYAAALAQSGVGTGDVEDNAIAVPPPPAYGHTRGSTLLLSGFMSDTLRVERHAALDRVRQAGNRGSGRSLRASWMTQDSRPVSYMSRDEEWEERSDRIRAVRLEETLARLEDARVRD
ncbi:hypothetical protein PsYK624_152440 [Phanerochaete sordida]|uniref:Uncharacterized protein n=1 Tax=Phanerochaete sordida TaxID=48140 RepID=A0A9P3GPX1_9APHY|nr:hypothetical protein PsYK624_152440 [Phanerochaete sordida]